jgi:hypothetical protein
MAHYYELPHDFYCWGQDRGGTLIPLLSQIFIKIFHCSALWAVSLSNYVILILGYVCLSSLIKSKYYRIIFAIMWFLPFQRFIDITRFPIGVGYSLLGVFIFLIHKFEHSENIKPYLKHLLLILMVLTGIVAIWASDLASVSFALLLLILFLFHCIKNKTFKIDKIVLCYAFIGVVLCGFFIKFAKSFAVAKTDNYLLVNGISEVKQALFIIKERLKDILIFNSHEIFVTIYIYLVILLIIVLAVMIFKKKLFPSLWLNKWICFFLADFVVIFGVFLSSSWVLVNDMGRWYFVASYISLAMVVLLILDKIELMHKIKWLKHIVLLTVIVGAISSVFSMKYIFPKSLKPKVEVIGEFKQLGEIGVIGNYWHSYIISCVDPELIKATPYDYIRNYKIMEMTLERENIYVIKNGWMSTFPDTLNVQGHILVKENMPFILGECDVCQYSPVLK